MKKRLKWIWFFWRGNKGFFAILALFTILSSIIMMAYPLVFKYLIDSITKKVGLTNINANYFFNISLILLLIGLLRSFANFYPAVRAIINSKFDMIFREYYFESILKKNYEFFQKFRIGDVVSRLTEDITEFPKLSFFMGSGIFRAVESASGFLLCLTLMLFINWKLSLLAILPLPIMLYIFSRFQSKIYHNWDNLRKEVGKIESIIESALSGIRIIKAYRVEEKEAKKLNVAQNDRIKTEIRVIKLWAILDAMYEGLGIFGQAVVILYGGYLVIKPNPELTLGGFYAFYIYMDMLLRPLVDIPNLFVMGKQSFAIADREEEMKNFNVVNEINKDGNKIEINEIKKIEFKDVEFNFNDTNNSSIKKLNFKIKRGERLIIMGKIGGGKSIIARLLLGQLKPTSGKILINGLDLNKINMISYLEKIGYGPQEPILFSDSISENISFGRTFSNDNILSMIKKVNLEDEIKLFEKGAAKELEIKGGAVSGGQRHRISLARALISNPELVILDDVTSSLDAKCEKIVLDNLENMLSDKISILITRNRRLLEKATLIVILDGGKIVDMGTARELSTRSHLYGVLAGMST